MKNADQLSRKSREVLAAFDKAACEWGYERNEGTGAVVEESRVKYEKAKAALEARLKILEGASATKPRMKAGARS